MRTVFLHMGISGMFLVVAVSLAFASALQEENEGKIIWDRLLSKTLTCSELSDDQFELMGEYFMGTMAGSSHEAMNSMMAQMMGQAGEEQMHIVMGKRVSGCDATFNISSDTMQGIMPMMMNMMGRQVPQTNMMGNWGYFGYWNFLNTLYIILLIGLAVLGYLWIVKLRKNVRKKGRRK